jgi:hypothetical protein
MSILESGISLENEAAAISFNSAYIPNIGETIQIRKRANKEVQTFKVVDKCYVNYRWMDFDGMGGRDSVNDDYIQLLVEPAESPAWMM